MATHHTLTPTSSQLSPITASINLPALVHNLAAVRRCIPPDCDVLAVVKADAYGHGARVVSQTLASLGVQRFGVSTVEEGVGLRRFGINHSILVMGALLPSQLPDLVENRLTPVISNEDVAEQLAELIDVNSAPYPVHIKVDTGMRRLGISLDAIVPFLDSPYFNTHLHVEGLMTHLAQADNIDSDFTTMQIQGFRQMVKQLETHGRVVPLLHVANSGGILYHPAAHMNLVRPGIMLYGYTPGSHPPLQVTLRPIMKVVTAIVQVRAVGEGERLGYNGGHRTARPSRIAILPVGYAHGYPRLLSNKGKVLIHGHQAPIVGNICMDMMFVDVTDLPLVHPGDEVILMGEQGSEEITAANLAQWAQTIPYEVLCNFGLRVNRVYESHSSEFNA